MFLTSWSAVNRQLADNQKDFYQLQVLKDTHAFLQELPYMSREASLGMKNLFEPRALRATERCVFCLNLLRQLSKLAD